MNQSGSLKTRASGLKGQVEFRDHALRFDF